MRRTVPLFIVVLILAGCTSYTAVNPSFDVTPAEAKQHLVQMRLEKATLDRPVIFVGPFLDPGLAEWIFLYDLRRYFDEDTPIAGVSFLPYGTFESNRSKLIAFIQQRFPSDDPTRTVEVDVIGFSMGGLVARFAALPPDIEEGPTRRLIVQRLFTISTPHHGAQLAPLGAMLEPRARDMRHGSDFLRRLDSHLADVDYELIPYVRLGDFTVGPKWAAPPGSTPYWVSNRPLQLPHIMAFLDPRIRADIIARLRGETPLTTPDPAPLPQ